MKWKLAISDQTMIIFTQVDSRKCSLLVLSKPAMLFATYSTLRNISQNTVSHTIVMFYKIFITSWHLVCQSVIQSETNLALLRDYSKNQSSTSK